MKTILRSQDLSCPSCVKKIETALGKINGVSEAQVKFNSGRIEVEHGESVKVETLQKTIRSLGYQTEESPV